MVRTEDVSGKMGKACEIQHIWAILKMQCMLLQQPVSTQNKILCTISCVKLRIANTAEVGVSEHFPTFFFLFPFLCKFAMLGVLLRQAMIGGFMELFSRVV